MDLSADTQINITMTAGEWSTCLFGLDELPRKQSQIPYSIINKAILEAATPVAEEVEVEEPKSNGSSKTKKKASVEAG